MCGASTCIDVVGLVSSSIGEGSSFGNAAMGVGKVPPPFGSDPLVTGCALLPEMFEHLAGRLVPHVIHAGFYKLIGHDDLPLMLGPSVQNPGVIGLFADCCSSCLPTDTVFRAADVLDVYHGTCVRVCDLTSEQLRSRYTFCNEDR